MLLAVGLGNWLAGRPGIRVRTDLTSERSSSLDPATTRLLEQLPGEVVVDVFFRAERPPLAEIVAGIQNRTLQLLELMRLEAGAALVVEAHDLLDQATVSERLTELRIRGLENCLVVSYADPGDPEAPLARQVVPMFGSSGCATVDLGNPDPNAWRPPVVQSFDAERSLVAAILKVTQGRRPVLCFSQGHGEGDPFEVGGDPRGYGRLETMLREDGFETRRWNGAEDADIPADCAVLAILEPSAPFSEQELASLEAFLERSGRVVIAFAAEPSELEASGLAAWAEARGVQVTPGLVCEPKRDAATTAPVVGGPQVAVLQALPMDMAPHPISKPSKDAGRALWLPTVHALRVARQPRLGLAQGIVRSPTRPPGSWLEEPPFNWVPDDEEDRLQRDLVIAWSQAVEDRESETAGDVVAERRIVFLGSGGLLQDYALESPQLAPYNRDFARNVFNWVADREFRVNVSPRDPALRRAEPEQAALVVQVALWGLPVLALALAGITAMVRRRGNPKTAGEAS